MALPFSMDGIGELLVEGYDGFDRPQSSTLVAILGTDDSRGDQVLQQGALYRRQARVTGMLFDIADVDLLRQYSDTKEVVIFTDGNARDYAVHVFDLSIRDFTYRWEFAMQLVAAEDVLVQPDPVALILMLPIVGVSVSVSPAPVAAVLTIPTPTVTAA